MNLQPKTPDCPLNLNLVIWGDPLLDLKYDFRRLIRGFSFEIVAFRLCSSVYYDL